MAFEKIYSERLNKEQNAFDFWIGNWEVIWKTWVGADNYEPTHISRHRVFAALDGKALIELAYEDSVIQESKVAGFSIRYFDEHLQKWVMFQSWPGSNSTNFSSLQGTHHHKRIQLYKDGVTHREFRGHPVGTAYINRYTFSDAHKELFRWESSISLDSMASWSTLTIAEGQRLADFSKVIDQNGEWYTQGDRFNCDDSLMAPLEPYLGEWTGEITYWIGKKKNTYQVDRVLKPFLGGCAALGYQVNYVGEEVKKEIIFVSYLTASDQWIFYTLNDRMGESHKTFFAGEMRDEVTFVKKDTLGVVSGGSLKTFTWQRPKEGRQLIEGSIPEKGWSFSMSLVKEEE